MKHRIITSHNRAQAARTKEIENKILNALSRGLEVEIEDLCKITGVERTNLHDIAFELNCRFIIRGNRRRIKVRRETTGIGKPHLYFWRLTYSRLLTTTHNNATS